MRGLMWKWIAVTAAFVAMSRFMPGVEVPGIEAALVVSAVYGIVVTLAQVLLLPAAYTIFLFVPRLVWDAASLFVVNAVALWGCTYLVKGFTVPGYQEACVMAAVIAVVAMVAERAAAD